MKLSISKKFAKRSIKCLALFAPLAYLFGSLFFGLNGAHGTQLWAETESTSYSVTPTLIPNAYADENTGAVIPYTGAVVSDMIFFVNDSTYSYSIVRVGNLPPCRFWFYDSDGAFLSTFNIAGSASPLRFTPVQGSVYFRYGSFYSLDDTTFLYSSPEVIPEVNAINNTAFTFGQFFAKDNFLQKWGENCISENPVGFAPFGAFFKFLDENMLHLSDSQIGLMGYGYIYYCLHVLIAFLAFDCVAFIPQLIMKVIHQFNKGVDSDD